MYYRHIGRVGLMKLYIFPASSMASINERMCQQRFEEKNVDFGHQHRGTRFTDSKDWLDRAFKKNVIIFENN